MDRIAFHAFVWLACVAPTLAGCGRHDDLVPVEGVLTLDGKPLGGATVFLVSDGGTARTATATTQDDGAFRLATYGADGISLGKYRAIVVGSAAPPTTTETASGTLGDRERAAWQGAKARQSVGGPSIPRLYTDSSTTPLRCTIPVAGKLQLELHSTGR